MIGLPNLMLAVSVTHFNTHGEPISTSEYRSIKCTMILAHEFSKNLGEQNEAGIPAKLACLHI